MTKDEVIHLSNLSRITLSEKEMDTFPSEIAAIVDYVGVVKNIVGNEQSVTGVGARYNVLRADEVTHEPGSYTETLLEAAPRRQNEYVVVNKILQQDE